MLRRIKKAQSTLEYMAIFAAVVGAIVVFSYQKIKPAVEGIMDSAVTKLDGAATDFETK